MATDVVILDGDKISISITTAIVPAAEVVGGVALTGNGFTTVEDRPVCIDGDELPPSLAGSPPVLLAYTTSTYTTAGTGTLSATLNANNKTTIVTDEDIAVLLKGSSFSVTFTVVTPATLSSTPFTPDPVTSYSGTASFISTNTLVEAE